MSRRISVPAVLLLVAAFAFASGQYFTAESQDTMDTRLADLETRVTLLEATVAALSEGTDASESDSSTHELTGVYVERPERTRGDTCFNFYEAGTIVFLTDWDNNVLGTGELGDGALRNDGLCAQPFTIEDIPQVDGYTVYFERRAPGSAYEFTLHDFEESDWNIEVRSRYRD